MRSTGYVMLVTALLAGSASIASGAIVYSDLDVYWRLDGNLMDSAGADNGSFVNQDGGGVDVVYAAGFDGKASGALDFGGTTDHVTTPYIAQTGAKSISFFFTTRQNTIAELMCGNGGNNRFYFGAHHNTGLGGSLVCALGDSPSTQFVRPDSAAHFTPTGTPVVPNDTWNHFVVTDDGAGNGTIYYRSSYDSQHLVHSWSFGGTAGGLDVFTIGAFAGGGWPGSGRVDDVAVFNRVLTQTEAESIYAAGSVEDLLTNLGAEFDSGEIIAYWKLDGDLTASVGSGDGSFVDHDGGGIAVTYTAGFDGVANGALDFGSTANKDNVETTFVTPIGPKSISLFFKSRANTPAQFLAGEGSNNRFYFGIHHPNLGQGSLLAAPGDGTGTAIVWPSVHFSPTGTDVSYIDSWHHLAVTDDGAGNATMYHRSPYDSHHAVYSWTYNGTSGGIDPLAIGGFYGSGGWALDGVVDDVAVFGRELTLDEVRTIYFEGSVDPLIVRGSTILVH